MSENKLGRLPTATRLVLGSYIAFIPIAFLPVALGMRIANEEKVLREGLEGYEEYTKRVKYRMIPFVW
jgi:protein-S-isoprenylcysteine O-methyltransferase Ste14